ncbi:MAG: hypothetical protein HQ454_00210 [Acidimicrobiaceae bacterium]|nr:hypothetical protein [Acidimicrobiaceae bacterium]
MYFLRGIPLALLLVVGLPHASAQAVVEWQLTDDAVSLGINGVSPHVEKTAGGDRVFRSDMVPSGTAVSMCNDAGACTSENLTVSGGGVSDFAIASTPSGVRAYFKRIDMASNTQAVYSAACGDASCLSFGTVTIASTGMQVSKDTKAWGVPDPVRLPDGRVRIYIVESPSLDSSCPEKVASYISSDGISFTKESGWRLENGYVDTEILRAKDGDWVMIMADGPGCTTTSGARKVQQLFVSTSNDGLTWAKPQVLTKTDIGRLDPTGYEVSPNVFRIYYAAGGSGAFDPNTVYSIKRATMRIADTTKGGDAGVTKTPAAKSKTITCVKGKTTKKFTATRCPKGWKKK